MLPSSPARPHSPDTGFELPVNVLAARAAEMPLPQRMDGDLQTDVRVCFTGRGRKGPGASTDRETFDQFMADRGSEAVRETARKLAALDAAACLPQLDANLVARALRGPLNVVSLLQAGKRGSLEDEIHVLGLGQCLLDRLLSQLSHRTCDAAVTRTVMTQLFQQLAGSAEGHPPAVGAAFVTALAEALNLLAECLAGSDPLCQAFIATRQRLAEAALVEDTASWADDEPRPHQRSRQLSAIRSQMRELLALPEVAGPGPASRVDAETVTRTIFSAMPHWRDGAVVARLARDQVRAVVAEVEASTGSRWEELSLDSAQLAIASLSSSAGPRQWPWVLPLWIFCLWTARVGGEGILHRDHNPMGLLFLEELRRKGLSFSECAAPVTIKNLPDGRHLGLPGGPIRLWQAQGALCAMDVLTEGGRLALPVDPWIVNQYAAGEAPRASDRLKQVVIEAIDTVTPGRSRELDTFWRPVSPQS